MRLNKRKVYFFRLFICIAVVISILVITATVFWLRSNVDRGDYDIFVSNMSDYQENLVGADTRISVARTVAMLLTEYDCVKKYAQTDSEYEQIDFGATLKIKEKILENQTVFQNLEYSIYVTGFSADFVVSCNGTMDIASMYSETGIDKQIIDKTFNQYIMPGKYSELIVTDEGENACYVTKCIYEDMETIYIINKLWAMEGISYTQRDGMTFVYIDGELNGFAKAGVEEHILNLRKNGSLPADQIVRMGSGLVLGDVFFRMMSHQPNVAVVGYYAAEVPAESIMHYTLIVLLSLIAAMILALVIAKTAYRPIDKLVNIFSSGEFYYGNEIEFITGKLEEIKNANSILNSTLDSQKNLVAKKILSDILNGYIWGNSIDEYAQEYQLKAFETNSVCILFEVNDSFLNVSRFYADDEIRMIMSNVFDIIESEFARKQITAFGFLESGKRILFVAKDCDTLKSDVISITDTIRSQTSINIVAVMSNKAQSFEGLRDMYSQLLVAIDKKLIFDDREMFMINDLDNQTELDWYYPINVESELIEYVVNGEKEKMIFLIKKLFDYNSKSFEKSSKNLNAFNFSMSVTIKRILQKINKTEAEVFDFEQGILVRLTSTDSVSETFQILKKSFEVLSKEVDDVRNMQPVKLSEEIYSYINSHICSDISLTEISEHFNVSVSFIGKVLKENYNINFKSYVNEMRIKKAMEIMDLEPNIKIKDVSERVGFNSSTSFIRVFQRIAECTPKQYLESKNNDVNNM